MATERCPKATAVAAMAGTLAGMCLVALWSLGGGSTPSALAQGYDEIAYQGDSPTKLYNVKVTMHAGPSEKWSWWEMDVLRGGKPVLSGYSFRPFYAWNCISRGRAEWQADSVLHFTNFSCEGRNIHPKFTNATGRAVPYTEVWMKSVDPQGFPHSPGIFLIFDLAAGATEQMGKGAQLFAGGKYFVVTCKSEGKTATARYAIPAQQGAPHGIDLTPEHNVTVTLTDNGPVISGGAFQALTEEEARALVPKEIVPYLTENDGRRPGDAEPKAAPPPQAK